MGKEKPHQCGCGHKHSSDDGLQCAGTDAARQNIVKQIDDGHWALMGILRDETHPFHTFTVGLYENFDHPELLIMGVDPRVAAGILNEIGARIKAGLTFETGCVYDEIITNYGAVFIPVQQENYDAYLGSALWYYQRDDFPVWQMVWPDPNGKFPWEEGCDERYMSIQPLLGRVPDNAAELHGLTASTDDTGQQ